MHACFSKGREAETHLPEPGLIRVRSNGTYFLLLDLLLELPPFLPPPAVKIVPVSTPTAKKPKYMIAAGREMDF